MVRLMRCRLYTDFCADRKGRRPNIGPTPRAAGRSPSCRRSVYRRRDPHDHLSKGTDIVTISRFCLLAAAALVLSACSTVEQRIGGAAAGAGTGAVVAGPVGAVVGGAAGAISGPSVVRATRRRATR
jgi:osmotically inducible lipoprotein OsmB